MAKTDTLGEQGLAFKRSARQLRTALWWRNARMGATVAALVLAALYILAAVVCSPTLPC